MSELIAILRAVSWRYNDPAAAETEKAMMQLCGKAAEEINTLEMRLANAQREISRMRRLANDILQHLPSNAVMSSDPMIKLLKKI